MSRICLYIGGWEWEVLATVCRLGDEEGDMRDDIKVSYLM